MFFDRGQTITIIMRILHDVAVKMSVQNIKKKVLGNNSDDQTQTKVQLKAILFVHHLN